MCSHHLVDPVACTPASGWEKGRSRTRSAWCASASLHPRLRFKTYNELNAWLMDKCIAYAKTHAHPERPDTTIWAAFEESVRTSFPTAAGSTDPRPAGIGVEDLPVRFDNNKYSVSASAVGRPVEIQALRRPDRDPPGWARRC